MTRDYIQLLFDYHYWTLNHLINCLQKLSPEQVTTSSPHFYHDTALQTVLHILDVDWSWIQMCMGLPGTEYLWEVEELPDLKAAQAFLAREKTQVKDYIDGLSESDLATSITFGTAQRQEEQGRILLHIVNHGTEHRTEIGHYLTECGNSPGELGLMPYLATAHNAA
jgi:uncharacterized damage-inducible protein DinB